MSIEVQRLESIQSELTSAFKWMGRATEYARTGDFLGSVYAINVAMQHWTQCQHYRDKLNDDFAETVAWSFISNKALEIAKKQIKDI